MTGRRSGVLPVDKGPGATSFEVVARLRRAMGAPKIGHGGTLDPPATGVLAILLGEATKLTPYLVDHDKEYLATVRLGVRTDTHDLTGRVLATTDVPGLGRDTIEAACRRLTGRLQQVPPMYSAIRHGGRRLHQLARAGIEVERAPRVVVVHSMTVEAVELPRLTVRIVCGRGTYVRVLAADLGEMLGVGAAVERLVRTRLGPFTLADATPWSEVQAADPSVLWARVRDSDQALPDLPPVTLDAGRAAALLHGQSVEAAGPAPGALVRLYDLHRFLGIGRVLSPGRVKPERILHADFPGPTVLPA